MPRRQRVDLDSGFASEVNSSSTVLVADAVFTGQPECVQEYASVTIFSYSDKASAANGLKVQWSTDGTNWDKSDSSSTVAATAFTQTLDVAAKFFRIVYTNGAVDQTEFRLQTIIKMFAPNA